MRDTLFNDDKVLIFEFNYVPNNGDIVIIKKGNMINSPLIKRVIATENQEIIIDYKIGKVFEKSSSFTLGLMFLPFIFYPILFKSDLKYKYRYERENVINDVACGNSRSSTTRAIVDALSRNIARRQANCLYL